MKKTLGLAGLFLGCLFTVGALSASSAPESTEDAEQPRMGSDAGPGTAPRILPKAPGRAPLLPSDAGPPGAKPMP